MFYRSRLCFIGQDYDRMKVLGIQADEAEKMIHRKKKVNPLTGFSSELSSHCKCNSKLIGLLHSMLLNAYDLIYVVAHVYEPHH